uniref:RRM domain-containing protein n=1 Tax=Romanomermis culicivorax TaxID=13658 RepID=A0A915IGP9_ROMCU
MAANDSTDFEEERERTLYVSNIHDDVTEDLLYELFIQAGPLNNVSLKKTPRGSIAFVEFKHEESIPYVISLMNNICLFNRPLNLKPRDGTKMAQKIADAQWDAARTERETRVKQEMEERERNRIAWQQQLQQQLQNTAPWMQNNAQNISGQQLQYYQQAQHVNNVRLEYMVQQHQLYMSQHQQYSNGGESRSPAASFQRPRFQHQTTYATPPSRTFADSPQHSYSRDDRQKQQYDDHRRRDYDEPRQSQSRSADHDRRRSKPY